MTGMITMFDSVDTAVLPPGYSYAGYVNGRYANYGAVRARFPGSDVLSIAVSADADADCLDIETYDATPYQAPGWVRRQLARGSSRPCLYASVSTMSTVLAALGAGSISRASVRLWTAHYAGEHVCGPGSCGFPVTADGTQWTDAARGLNLDQSLLVAGFFAMPVTYLSTQETDAIMSALPVLSQGMDDAHLPHWYVRRVQAVLNAVYGAGIAADGAYGPATASHVRTLQQASGITADGITGPATWRVLCTGSP